MALALWECTVLRLNFHKMNNFRIEIKGMHCDGCTNLIKMTLEDDLGFKDVSVSLQNNEANFETEQDYEKVGEQLDSIFKKDLTDYKYSNLTQS